VRRVTLKKACIILAWFTAVFFAHGDNTIVRFDTVARDDAATTVTWSGPVSVGLDIERASALDPELWSTVSSSNRTGVFLDEGSAGERQFYRVRLPE
jgi:hypothetical protein